MAPCIASTPGLPHVILKPRPSPVFRMFAAYAQLKRARNGGGMEPRLSYVYVHVRVCVCACVMRRAYHQPPFPRFKGRRTLSWYVLKWLVSELGVSANKRSVLQLGVLKMERTA